MKYGVFYIQRSICCFTGKLQRVSICMSVACLRLELTSRRQALPVRLSFTEQAGEHLPAKRRSIVKPAGCH
jgi:hypothetical protein